MIPSTNDLLRQDFTIEETPSQTYRIVSERQRIHGFIDRADAVKQAIYKTLGTERYQYAIYSWNYGVEFNDLYGQPTSYALPEIERRVTEALTADSRIASVDNFAFTVEKGKIHMTFTAHTVFGDIAVEKAVAI